MLLQKWGKQVQKNIINVRRFRNSRTAKSKQTSRDDGIKQLSMQQCHVLCRRWGCILNRLLCHHPCLFSYFYCSAIPTYPHVFLHLLACGYCMSVLLYITLDSIEPMIIITTIVVLAKYGYLLKQLRDHPTIAKSVVIQSSY